jgi:alpha-L-fucosidase
MKHQQILLLFIAFLFSCQKQAPPPSPVMPVPTQAQIDWQRLEYYAFVHFNMNTFSNMEWGLGDEKPTQFNPSELDCRQWARVAKEAGMKAIILTTKHHDGFCLWPSEFTEHSVKNSPWKDGKGDVVKELSEACKEYGLKFGVYLSPWDRNHADYGTPEYITYFRNQLRELLTNYGEIFEVWFDGANGGTGYYGGANEERKVDKLTYYDWQNTYKIIEELQPNAIIFSDAGPGCRWIGNEHGFSYPTTWSNIYRDSIYGGMPEYSKKYAQGQENGTHWVPGEADVSIRPGWYYHEYEDHKVKSVSSLLDIYYNSVGQNSTLLLNFPVDKRGLIHENDVEQLNKLTAKLKEDFAEELAFGNKISASDSKRSGYHASYAIDQNINTYWAASDGNIESGLTIDFKAPTTFNRFIVQEHIALGQRVKSFILEAKTDGAWQKIASETTIGYKRILRLPDVTATAVRLIITDAKACPTISNIEIYNAPKLLVPPVISRNQESFVNITVPEEGVDIYYTTDGSSPTSAPKKFEAPFLQYDPAIIQAISVSGENQSEVSKINLDVSSTLWEILEEDEKAQNIFDGDPKTFWTDNNNEFIIDLGEEISLTGFTYLPMQNRWISGFIKDYEFYISTDNKTWELASKGEFGNILNSPILQRVNIEKKTAKFIKFRASKTVDGNPASIAEFGVLTQ